MSKKQGNTDQKKQQKSTNEMPNMNGVVITVYAESTSRIIPPLSKSKPDKKVKTNPVPKKAKRSQGYDRRAQLLDYCQELRTADNDEQIQWNEKCSRHKSKKWKCPTTPSRIGISFLGIFRKTKWRWKYQRMPSEKRNKRKKKHGRRKLWRKLKRMFRCLSSVWQRKKG